MAELKTAQLVVAIEPSLREVVNKIDKGNTSAYIRDLIVKDLTSRGLLTKAVIFKLFEIEDDGNESVS